MRRSSQSQQPAGVPFAHLVPDFDIAHGCPKSRRLYQFFESTSFNARLSSVSSATTCFSLRFSSSSCRNFLASLVHWAQTIGPHTARLFERILADKPHPEMGYRSCLGLIRLAGQYSSARVEAAAERALA